MRSDLTDVTVILDRSGSMTSCREEAENGVNHFIERQRTQPGDCLFSLIQFDTEYEIVHRGVPIAGVPRFVLVPRDMTALLDAVGRAINETGERLAAMNESQRPGLVVFVIVTDGEENSSHEFTKRQIKDMIEHQQQVYRWEFTFLGANQDAFAEARQMGIAAAATANYSARHADRAFECVASNVERMRLACMSKQNIDCSYTAEELAEMEDPAP